MIVRRGPDRIRDVVDHGPGAANVAGIYAVNVIAYVPASPEAEIVRRWIDPVIAEPDPPKPVEPSYAIRPKKVITVKVRKPRYRDDSALWSALRQTRGNVKAAAELMGRNRSTIRANVLYRAERGWIPDDIVAMLAAPARRPSGWKKGTRHHTAEARALISLRLREYNAARRAA